MLPDLKTVNLKGKRVFLRLDLDVPLKEINSIESGLRMVVLDDTRLVVSMPTLEYLLSQGASVIVGGHLRRPVGIDKALSLRPVAKWIAESAKFKVTQGKIDEFEGWRLSEQLFILENLRFYKEETEDYSKPEALVFGRKLASLADIYVNDSFAACHRGNVSIVGIPQILPHYPGFHLLKEIEVLSRILENPKRPLVVLIGGKKIETKLPLVAKMHSFGDYVLIGGKLALETEKLLKLEYEKKGGKRSTLIVGKINSDGTDLIEESIDEFREVIKNAATIIWNGPVGMISSKFNPPAGGQSSKFTTDDSEYGTWRLANAIVESKAYTVAGGGDTLGFLKQIGLLDKFSFFSTGGGAMLSFLSGEELPGIKALRKNSPLDTSFTKVYTP